jgi:hypothetical protein
MLIGSLGVVGIGAMLTDGLSIIGGGCGGFMKPCSHSRLSSTSSAMSKVLLRREQAALRHLVGEIHPRLIFCIEIDTENFTLCLDHRYIMLLMMSQSGAQLRRDRAPQAHGCSERRASMVGMGGGTGAPRLHIVAPSRGDTWDLPCPTSLHASLLDVVEADPRRGCHRARACSDPWR